MSSGYGLSGGMSTPSATPAPPLLAHPAFTDLPSLTGPSRCFPFWQEVLACYVVNTSAEDDSGKKKCAAPLEDYYECLHHRKEVCLAHAANRGTDDLPERSAL